MVITWEREYLDLLIKITREKFQDGTIVTDELLINRDKLLFYVSGYHYDQHGLMFAVNIEYDNIILSYHRLESEDPLADIRENIISACINSDITASFVSNLSSESIIFLDILNTALNEKLEMIREIGSIDFIGLSTKVI